ncbi:MAG: 5'-3' exonuclease [Actinobacteria bacterium]|nr:5'-3' exonuclease [Actinomycetota bacterium]
MAGKPLTVLVDSASLIYRAYFAVPDTIRTEEGMQVNAAYGFLSMLARLIAQLRPQNLACAWDDDWRPQWRVDLVESYKTHRVLEPGDTVEESIEEQMDLIAKLLDLAGIAVAGAKGYEAEDVIGTLIPRIRGHIAIVSGDRDLFQLVRDPDVWVLYPVRGVSDLTRIDEAEIEKRYGIPGRRYADFAVLRGDPSDGLPGVPGIGQKTATALIAKYGSLKAVVQKAKKTATGPLAKVANHIDYIERATQVVRIAPDAPVPVTDLRLPRHPPDPKLANLAKKCALSGPVDRLLLSMS